MVESEFPNAVRYLERLEVGTDFEEAVPFGPPPLILLWSSSQHEDDSDPPIDADPGSASNEKT